MHEPSLSDTAGMTDDSEDLRVLLADQKASRLDEIAEVVEALGHQVVARLYDVSDVAEATRREQPDVAIVRLGEESLHALELISELVKKAACPVIADMATEDDDFIDNAAKRGIFAYVKHGSRSDLAHALDIVLRRYAEFTRIHGALGRRVIIEQAKGILMERRGISADDAFADLRSRARNTNTTVLGVAEAVVTSYPLFRTAAPEAADPTGDHSSGTVLALGVINAGDQRAVQPWSIRNGVPVIVRPAGVHRKATASATSAGSISALTA